jgi:hypothetical protein
VCEGKDWVKHLGGELTVLAAFDRLFHEVKVPRVEARNVRVPLAEGRIGCATMGGWGLNEGQQTIIRQTGKEERKKKRKKREKVEGEGKGRGNTDR